MPSCSSFRAGLLLLTSLATGLAPALSAATSSASAPAGVMQISLGTGNTGLSFPLIASDIAAGLVTASTATSLTLASGSVGPLLVASGRYYVEVASGALEGERFDVNVAATQTAGGATVVLDLATTSNSTLFTLANGALVNARVVVRPHVTLAGLASMLSPALVGNNNSALADGVQILNSGVLTLYYLRADGATWREAGKTVDERYRVIPPDCSVIVVLRSGAKTLLQAGAVRTNAFRKRVVAGLQSFASGFPMDLTPTAVGAFTDTAESASLRWVGNATASLADQIRVFSTASNAFVSYSLGADGIAWTPVVGGGSVTSTSFIPAMGMVVIARQNPDAGYLILRPFSL